MELPCTLDRRQLETLERLRAAERRHLKWLFRQCPPPQLDGLEGEFSAGLLHQGSWSGDYLTRFMFGSSGTWIGKAFCPISATTGVGYNCFRVGHSVKPKLPMDITIEQSTIEPGKSLVLRYGRQNAGPIRWLVGEVREISSGVLLGFGLFGPRIGRRDLFRRKIPFVLAGPVREYQFAHRAAPFGLHKAA